MPENKQVNLVPFEKAEADKILAEINEVLMKHGAEIVVRPLIMPTGVLGAQAELFKKVEAPVPTPSEFMPIKDGGETAKEEKAD